MWVRRFWQELGKEVMVKSVGWMRMRRRRRAGTRARRKTLSQSSQFPMEATQALQRFVSLL